MHLNSLANYTDLKHSLPLLVALTSSVKYQHLLCYTYNHYLRYFKDVYWDSNWTSKVQIEYDSSNNRASVTTLP